MARELSEVGVVGLGIMGAGIVEVMARAGLSVTAVEVGDEALTRGRGHLERSTDRAVARGRLDPADRDAIVQRVRFSTATADLARCELVVEAVPERLELKTAVLAALDEVCPPGTILATNTSSLSVTELAVASGRPGRVVGMHFFNPAPVMRLVEVVRTVVTEPEVVEDVASLARRLGKVAVTIGDRAGFVANALLFGYLNQAVSMVEEGHASREDVDTAMRLGGGLPMGPLALMDLIGLDTAYQILDTMHRQSGNRRHAPSPVLGQLVTAGFLGRKSGRGFYTYAGRSSAEVVPDARTPSADRAEGAREVRTVGVVGSGPRASGLVEYFAAGGYDVRRYDRTALGGIAGRDIADRDIADRDIADRDLVVAAVDEPDQAALFADLGRTAGPGAVLASTSGQPVIGLATAGGRPADVVGMHPCGPGEEVRLVEVVSTVSTAPDAAATAHAVCDRLGVPAVDCTDRAGFVVDALLVPYLNDAVRMLEARYATADDIDAAMTLGCGYPVGPIEQLDRMGLDVALDVLRAIHAEVREPGLAPAPLLGHLVTAGRLGRSTGRGVRDAAAGRG